MKDRIKGFYVAIDIDIREDDFKSIKNAILMIKHVIAVNPSVVIIDDYINRKQIENELKNKILDILYDDK